MKKTFKDYKPQLYKLELVDPFDSTEIYKEDEDGIKHLVDIKYKKTGAWLMLVSANDMNYRREMWRIERIKAKLDPEVLEKKLDDFLFILEENAKLLSTRVVDWDEKFFGLKCNKENVKEFFMGEDASWIAEQVNRANDKESNFFSKPTKSNKVSKSLNKIKQNES